MSVSYPLVPCAPIPPIPVDAGSDRGEIVVHAIPQVCRYIEMENIGYARWEHWYAKSGQRAWRTNIYCVRWNMWTWGGEVWKIGATR